MTAGYLVLILQREQQNEYQYFQSPRTISRESFRPSTLAPAGILRCAMLTPDAQRIFKNYDASDGWETT